MTATTSRPERIVLIGLMGAGKTTVGRRVAAALDWPFVDNDEAFTRTTGTTAADYADAHGDAAMHAVEHAVFRDQFAVAPPAVLAIAGSVAAKAPAALDAAFVAYLRVSPAALVDRVGSSDHRPLLEDDTRNTLARMQAARDAVYEHLSDVVVDAGRDAVPNELAERIIAAWRASGSA